MKRAEGDDVLADTSGSRIDVPEPIRHELLETATEAVRARILEATPLEMRGCI